MATDTEYEAGDVIVREIGEVTCSDGEVVRGAIVEFPAGPPHGMTWSDVWDGTAFHLVRTRAQTTDEPAEG